MFHDEERFNEGDMDDAVEAFDAVLAVLHDIVAARDAVTGEIISCDNIPKNERCCVHQIFGVDIFERGVCLCSDVTELKYTSFIFYANVKVVTHILFVIR